MCDFVSLVVRAPSPGARTIWVLAMHRPGLLASRLCSLGLLVLLPALAACPKEQMGPGDSAGPTSSTGETAASPTTGVPTTGAASTGSSGVPTEASSTGTSAGASTGEGTSGEAGASSSSSGDSGHGGTGDASTGEPPRLTDCFGCLCDINVSFCRIVFAGVQAAQLRGPDPLCPIVEAGSQESGCVLYPARCGEAPGCECLPTMDGGCFCNEIEPGEFQVACPLP